MLSLSFKKYNLLCYIIMSPQHKENHLQGNIWHKELCDVGQRILYVIKCRFDIASKTLLPTK
jgi:hypothetical protein